jgi:hypothetical protein
MKAVSVKEIKTELNLKSHQEVLDLCLRLSKFKKENKELLTYLLFESDNEESYIADIKTEIDTQFKLINTKSYFYIKKSVRKILRRIKTYIRYSQNNETQIELLLYFCFKMKHFTPSIKHSKALNNIFLRELESIRKKLPLVHQDLQYDYGLELQALEL